MEKADHFYTLSHISLHVDLDFCPNQGFNYSRVARPYILCSGAK